MRLCLSPFTSKVAFGAKRTSTGRQNRLDRSKMTRSGGKPSRKPAAQRPDLILANPLCWLSG